MQRLIKEQRTGIFLLGASYQRNDKSGRREGEMFIVNTPENKTTFLPSDGERSFDEVTYNGRFNVDYTPNESDTYSLGFFAGKRTKERLADIVYYDNHSISRTRGEQLVITHLHITTII